MPAEALGHPVIKQFETTAADYAATGRLRVRRRLMPAAAPHVRYDGRMCINFCSNDYLGLAADKRVAAALAEGGARYGTGAGASQLVCGYSEIHAELEEALAEHCGYERALLFSSGYMANLGTLSALCDRGSAIFLDRLAHASLIDGAVLSRARLRRYGHNNMDELEQALGGNHDSRKLVVTEGVFSMEGDCADLPRIAAMCRSAAALLYLDDAHAFGLLGAEGRGSRSHYGLGAADVPLMMATLGKALGVSGAFVAGSAGLIETILQRARTLIYTTSPPPALAAATLKALAIVRRDQWRRDKLQELIGYWREQAARHELPLLSSRTPIQPLMIGANDRAVAASEALLERGLLIGAIRPPTVPEGSARLRITLSAAHDRTDIDRLIVALAEMKRFLPIQA